MVALEIFIIGILGLFGLFWQFRLLESSENERMLPAVLLSLVIILGVFIRGIIAIFLDGHSDYEWDHFGMDMLKVIVLSLSFNIKTYLGPIFCAFTLGTTVYFLFETGEFHTVGFIKSFMYWIFQGLDAWVKQLYAVVSFLIVFGGSIYDTDVDIF